MNSTRTRPMLRTRATVPLVALSLLLVLVAPAVAQEAGGLASQSLGRPYRFVFLAYALLWLLVFGWVFSVGRRISKLADRMRD